MRVCRSSIGNDGVTKKVFRRNVGAEFVWDTIEDEAELIKPEDSDEELSRRFRKTCFRRNQENVMVELAGDDPMIVNLILGSGIKGHGTGFVRTVVIKLMGLQNTQLDIHRDKHAR